MRKQRRLIQWCATILVAAFPAQGFAASLSFQNLTAGNYDDIVKEFSGNFIFTSVAPASSLGGLGGFELGLVGGKTDAPAANTLVKNADPSSSFKGDLYHAGALGRIGLPYALTAELLIFPSMEKSGVKFQQYGGALMWTATDEVLANLPVNIAAKFHYTAAKVSYSQRANVTSNGVTAAGTVGITFEDKIYGLQALVSKKLLMFEPYLGFGYAKAKGTLSVAASGTTNLFAGGFVVGNSASTSPSSVQILGGVDVLLAFFSLGAEYQKAFGTDSLTGRLSFRF